MGLFVMSFFPYNQPTTVILDHVINELKDNARELRNTASRCRNPQDRADLHEAANKLGDAIIALARALDRNIKE